MIIGHNKETIALTPSEFSLYFPSVLSRRSDLDKSVSDLMRPLFDNGFHVEAFFKLLNELRTK